MTTQNAARMPQDDDPSRQVGIAVVSEIGVRTAVVSGAAVVVVALPLDVAVVLVGGGGSIVVVTAVAVVDALPVVSVGVAVVVAVVDGLAVDSGGVATAVADVVVASSGDCDLVVFKAVCERESTDSDRVMVDVMVSVSMYLTGVISE